MSDDIRHEFRSMREELTLIRISQGKTEEALTGAGGLANRMEDIEKLAESHGEKLAELHRFKYWLLGAAAAISALGSYIGKTIGIDIHNKP